MKFGLIAAAGVLLAATPAFAQDGTGTSGFSGIYVGAAGGYDVQPNDAGRISFDRDLDGRFGDGVLTATGANAFGPGFCGGRGTSAIAQVNGGTCANDEDGWAYYGRVGFDHQIGRVVIGAVGEFGKTEINDQVTGFSTTPANYVMYRSVSWEAGARARLGYTPNDTTLMYGTFGPGYARIDRDFTSSQSTNQFEQRGKRNQWGIQGGGGIEQRLGEHFSVGLEYLYHQYDDDDFRVRAVSASGAVTPFTNPGNGGTAQGTDFRRTDDKFRWHSIRATAAFRF
jgi:outer membrane immunogenic protein